MDAKIKRFILSIIRSQYDLTLATLRQDGYPQANTVSYASDGLILYFGTVRESQKLRNLQHCNKVSLTIGVPYADRSEIRALSMGGIAEVLADDGRECRQAADLVTRRYPAVVDAPPPGDPSSIVFVKITPQVISVLDYRKGFGHAELVSVAAADLRP
jgi:nitroimidazol reductase NimA-like FMN-containing flavoprotein (pyridoxamine 5'-phosphate oxidase superfamily)